MHMESIYKDLWYYLFSGSSYITINPRNQTTCWNSSASYSCAISESRQINWLINGQDVLAYQSTSPYTYVNLSSPGAQSTLTLPGSYDFDGATVTCYYKTLYSIPALLRVQGLWKNVFPCLPLYRPHVVRPCTEPDNHYHWLRFDPSFLDAFKWRTVWVISGLCSSGQGWKWSCSV